MITTLRILSLLLGCILTLAPSYLVLTFAWSVGEPPDPARYLSFFLPTLAMGLAIGAGPLLVGIPGIVVGKKNPKLRILATVLLGVPALFFVFLGVEGSVTRIVTPIILLLEAVLFSVFVWPAKRFQTGGDRSA
jgi:hypothetical protein